MTKLLISVRDAQEARQVLAHDIGILDVKEPDRGALGRSDPESLQVIGSLNESAPKRERTNGNSMRVPRSFAAGELSEWMADSCPLTADTLLSYYGNQVLGYYQFVKVGLAGLKSNSHWKTIWRTFFESLPEHASPVAVAYFDYRQCNSLSPDQMIDFASERSRCKTVLFDTYDKSANLFRHCTPGELGRWVEATQSAGMKVVIAGSVDRVCLGEVLDAAPDYVGVRGAVCRGQRTGRIDESLLVSFLDEVLDGGVQVKPSCKVQER